MARTGARRRAVTETPDTTGRLEEQALEAWRAFLIAHAGLVDALERELVEEQGMPLAFYEVLVALNAAPHGQLRMQELADRLLLSRSGFTRLCDRMESAGFLERTRCPSDRRGVYAVMTDAGRRALEAATPVHLRGVREHFVRHLGADDVVALRAMLERLCAGNRGDAPACADVLAQAGSASSRTSGGHGSK